MIDYVKTILLLALCLVGASACATMQLPQGGVAPGTEIANRPSPVAPSVAATSSVTATNSTTIPATLPMLAYVQSGDVWVKPLPDGEAQRLTTDGMNQSPLWSASGQWLTFVKNPNAPELWAIQSDGTNGQQIDAAVAPDVYATSSLYPFFALYQYRLDARQSSGWSVDTRHCRQ